MLLLFDGNLKVNEKIVGVIVFWEVMIGWVEKFGG